MTKLYEASTGNILVLPMLRAEKINASLTKIAGEGLQLAFLATSRFDCLNLLNRLFFIHKVTLGTRQNSPSRSKYTLVLIGVALSDTV